MATKVLSVAEKPSVAKELAKIIAADGQANRRVGHSPYNHVFDIRNCSFRGQRCDMSITSVTGHLMEIDFDLRYKGWKSCAPLDLFEAPLNKFVKKENEPIKKTLSDEARKCNVLLLWLDCDLEGENICFEVIKVCKEANPRLDIYRARFSALIPRDIFRTLQHPERPNEHYNDAIEARQEIDLRLGAAFTRFQTLRLQDRFPALANAKISYGPCQFPTLGFVVERHLQIQAFRPETYWVLSCTYEGIDGEYGGKISCNFHWVRGHVYDRYTCAILYESCIGDGQSVVAKIIKCDARPTHRYRPAPLNTIELQKRASTFLRMSSDRTMQVAESLYQQGILSYPRTETDFFKDGFEIMPLLEDHRGHADWGAFVSQLIDQPGKFLWPKNGGHDDQAHPPIHPTKCVELNTLEGDERAIYDLVSRHFFACCARDGVGQMTNITIEVSPQHCDEGRYIEGDIQAAHGELFTASGLMIIERNWLEVYARYEKWTATRVPKFRVGDTFRPASLVMTGGQTTPPPALSEVDLISDMDKNGIGTDATIATHIATIQQREYAVKDGNNRFVPTKLGLALVEGYNTMGYQLNKPFLRAAMEKDCQMVAKGLMRKDDMVARCLATMRQCFIVCNREATKLDAAMRKHFSTDHDGVRDGGEGGEVVFATDQPSFSTCGVCDGVMALRVRSNQNGPNSVTPATPVPRQLFCSNCRAAHPLPANGSLRTHPMRCPLCNFQVLIVTNAETGRDHTVCPYCFRNPPPPPYSIEEGTSTEFRCFNCGNDACALSGRIAGGEIDVIPCIAANCLEFMRVKKTKAGFMLSCTKSTCNKAFWFPKFLKNVSALSDVCPACTSACGSQIHKLRVQCNLSIAPPGTPPEAEVCPCCSDFWLDCNAERIPRPAHRHQVISTSRLGSSLVPAQNVSNSTSDSSSAFAPQARSFDSTWMPGSSTAGLISAGSDYGAALAGRGVGRGGKKSSVTSAGRGGQKKTNSAVESGRNDPLNPPNLVTCGCGITLSAKTVGKEGPNKGRRFYSCSNQRRDDPSSGCNFFQWEDDVVEIGTASSEGSFSRNSASNSGSSRGGRGRGGRAGTTSNRITASSSDICAHCKQPGHYARSCPNK